MQAFLSKDYRIIQIDIIMDFTMFDMDSNICTDTLQYDDDLSSDIYDTECFSTNNPFSADQNLFEMPDTDNDVFLTSDSQVSFKGYLEELQEGLKPFRDDNEWHGEESSEDNKFNNTLGTHQW